MPPVVCHEIRLQPLDPIGNLELFKVRYIWDEYPEYLDINEDYYLDKWPSGKHIRGVAIEGDTKGNTISMSVQYDNGNVAGILSITQPGKTLSTFAFATPFVANEIRVIPLGNWRRFSVRWIFDEYPDYAALISAWADCGTPRAKYLRGGILRFDSVGATLTPVLQYDIGGVATITPTTFASNGQNELAFALQPPVVVHLVRWVPDIAWRYWMTEWDFDVYPELIPEYTSIIELGSPSAKFIQGLKMTADTGGVSTQFRILYDGGQSGPLIEAAFTGKQTQVFPNALNAFTPFIAHNLQIRPLTNARVFIGETEWIWEPTPDFATVWQTQETDHDMLGYQSCRDCWIAYQSSAGAVDPEVLTITTQYGTATYNLPVSTTYARIYMPLAPQKAPWHSYKITSTLGVRVFVKDTIIRLKAWADSGRYTNTQPIGDMSRQIGARV